MELHTRNVNTAIAEMLWKMKISGVEENTRNGPALVYPEPVMTIYQKPQERVLFWGERDANPVFHLMESIYILAGRRDVKFPAMFNSRIGQYSDDGLDFNAAYGWRIRNHFGFDQLENVITALRDNPTTRRAVMQIWCPLDLLNTTTKDMACNTQIMFEIKEGELNMTVINRSNDGWYGAYGANVVHFSFLMEFVAHAVGVPMGLYRQFSHNFHFYTELYDIKKYMVVPPNPEAYDMYAKGVRPRPIMQNGDWKGFLDDCKEFCHDPFAHPRYVHEFFHNVAYPMAMVSKVRKEKSGDGLKWADMIEADDWRIATEDWVERREAAKAK